jgi:MoaA/NifB/PqqE/SkfB family radical SAM enzyme
MTIRSQGMVRPRVLVVAPPMSVARDFIDYPFFADLGAVQLAAVLETEADVRLVDAFALSGAGLTWREDGRAHLGATVARTLAAAEPGWDLACVAYSPFHRPPLRDDVLGAVLEGLHDARPHAPILLVDAYQSGQHYVEAAGEAVLAAYPEVHAWVKYEAEVTVPALVRAFANDGEPGPNRSAIRGERPVDLDALPLPAWARVDLKAHDAFRASIVAQLGRGGWAFPIDGRTLPVVTSRGCPYTCIHCSSNPDRRPGEPKTQRRLSAARMRGVLGELRRVHGATRVHVLDELVNVNPSHFDALLEEMERLDLRFEVPNGMRADHLQRRHFARMRGRITTLSVSAESGSARVLAEVVDKKLDLQSIERAAEEAHRAGIALMIHWMIGLPGETKREINDTLEHALRLWDEHRAWPAVQFATPLPGTRLAAGASLPVVDDWGPRFQHGPSALSEATPDELRRFKATFDARLSASQGPKKLVMNVTYVCNNHCTFCAVGTRTQIDGHPTRQRELLQKYRRQGVTMVDFDGGEPTLNPQLVPLVRYARAIGYERVNVTTNGRMCAYPEFAEKLVRSGLTTLLFSIHGADARTHAQQVGVAEAFEQSTTGIRNCRAARPEGVELGMNITLTKGNHRQLPEVAQLAWDLGLPWLNIQFLTPFGRATRMVAPDTAVAAEIAMRTIDAWRDRMKIQVINLPFCFMPGYEAHMMGDLGKLERHMAFVNNEEVNLASYLAERRTRKPVCESCPHACFCGGFYELDDVPEPPWLVHTDDLLRRIQP